MKLEWCSHMKKFREVLICLVLFAALFAAVTTAEAKVRVKKVRIKSNYGKIVHVGKGKKVRVSSSVQVRPNRSSYKKVRYKSKNKRIARINSIGEVRGVRFGTTRVYAISRKNKKKKASIKVRVVKPLKKIILKEKKKTVKVGERFEIKKSVVPSNSGFKRVVWSSSVPSVAKVSSAGVVSALSPGNAKITAKAVDGSGTKAVCSVKVESLDTVNIASVRALSYNTVRVSLDRELPLEKDKFELSGKISVTGDYNRSLKIKTMRNHGNRTYDLQVKRGYSIQKNSMIRVSVPGLPGNGVKSMEAEALFIKEGTPKDVYVTGEAGTYIDPLEVDLSQYGCGSLVYQIGSLPDGITASVSNNTIVFRGKTGKSYFGKTTVISAIDELGKESKVNVYWYIGAADSLVGYAENRSLVFGEEISGEKAEFLHMAGGSGKYEFTFSGLPAGMQGDRETGVLSGTPQGVGEYTVRVTVADKDDNSRKIVVSASVKVETGFNLYGTLYDSQGFVMPGVKVSFQDQMGLNRYTAVTDANGIYRLRVVGGIYDGIASANQKDVVLDDIYELAVEGDSVVDFYPECYRVNLYFDQSGYVLEEKLWSSNADKDAVYEGEDILYVLPGTYDIMTSATRVNETTGEKEKFVLRAVFTVGQSAVNATVSGEKVLPEEKPDEKEEEKEKEEENQNAE